MKWEEETEGARTRHEHQTPEAANKCTSVQVQSAMVLISEHLFLPLQQWLWKSSSYTSHWHVLLQILVCYFNMQDTGGTGNARWNQTLFKWAPRLPSGASQRAKRGRALHGRKNGVEEESSSNVPPRFAWCVFRRHVTKQDAQTRVL